MSQRRGKVELPIGTVYWSPRPTRIDKTGCDGLYIERVDPKPFRCWPARCWPLLAWLYVCALVRVLWRRAVRL